MTEVKEWVKSLATAVWIAVVIIVPVLIETVDLGRTVGNILTVVFLVNSFIIITLAVHYIRKY